MLNFITIVFKEEIEYLKTQAQSIVNYVNDCTQITVIVNDDDSIIDQIDTAWWGKYQDRVVIKPQSQYNFVSRINGWESQQLLKLLAGAESPTEWSMVLDAKTWFVRPLSMSRLFDEQGRACVGRVGIFTPFVDSQRTVEQHYRIEFTSVLGPGGVPFMFHTKTVQDLIASVDDFIEFFQVHVRYPHLVNEFHLYSGHVLATYSTYDTLYSPKNFYQPVNIAEWEAVDFDKLFNRITLDPGVLTASIHRRTYKLLSSEQIAQWDDFLIQRKIKVPNLAK